LAPKKTRQNLTGNIATKAQSPLQFLQKDRPSLVPQQAVSDASDFQSLDRIMPIAIRNVKQILRGCYPQYFRHLTQITPGNNTLPAIAQHPMPLTHASMAYNYPK
jgi:hypothetical protein